MEATLNTEPEVPAMPPSPSYSSYRPKRHNKYRKHLIYGAFLLLVIVLVYVVYKQKGYINTGFSANNIPDGKKIPTPCKSSDHARVLYASYVPADVTKKPTNVATTLQAAYTAQAGNAPYTVDSTALLGASTPGALTFRAECPQGRIM